jgi:hypothetical protein
MNILGIRSIGIGVTSALVLGGASLLAQDAEPFPEKARASAVIVSGPDRVEIRGPAGEKQVKRIVRENNRSEDVLIQGNEDDDEESSNEPKPKPGKREKKVIIKPGQRLELHDGEANVRFGNKDDHVIVRRGPKEIREFRFEGKPMYRTDAWAGPTPPKFFQFEESPRQHLESAIRHLHEAGMHQEAEKLEAELPKMPTKRAPGRGVGNPDEMASIKADLERLQKELRSVRRDLEKLGARDGKEK